MDIKLKKKISIALILIILLLTTIYSYYFFIGFNASTLVSYKKITDCEKYCWHYDIHPDSNQIVYTEYKSENDNRIYLVDINGKNKKEIAINTNHSQPLFSDDGKYILYLKNDRLTISDSDGNNMIYLTNETLFSTRFEPAGYDITNDKVVFSFQKNITVADIDGSNQKIITQGFNPKFSHNGEKVLFERNIGDPVATGWKDEIDYNQSLRIINIDGTNEIELARYDYRYFFLNKQFYKDNSKIFFTVEFRHHPIESDNGIWVVDSDGKKLERLIEGATSFAFFHPNKNIFYYYSNTWAHHTQFYKMNLDGSNKKRLTAYTDYFGWASINPDGTKIVFSLASDLHDGNFNIWIMNSDGSNRIRLTDTHNYHGQVSFSSNGKYILFVSRDNYVDGNDHIHRINYDDIEYPLELIGYSPYICYPLSIILIVTIIYLWKFKGKRKE